MSVFCFFLAFWLRMYVHYIGQWYYLTVRENRARVLLTTSDAPWS